MNAAREHQLAQYAKLLMVIAQRPHTPDERAPLLDRIENVLDQFKEPDPPLQRRKRRWPPLNQRLLA